MKELKKLCSYMICSIIMLLGGCQNYLNKSEQMFKLHVLNPIPDTIENIMFYRYSSAMHSPLFFRFETKSEKVIKMIIKKHNLKSAERIPEVIDFLNDAVNKKITWWKSSKELNNMRKYCIFYSPLNRDRDWQARCLFIGNEYIYFITTGFFPTNEYVIEKVAR